MARRRRFRSPEDRSTLPGCSSISSIGDPGRRPSVIAVRLGPGPWAALVGDPDGCGLDGLWPGRSAVWTSCRRDGLDVAAQTLPYC